MFGRSPFGVIAGLVLVVAIAAGVAYLAYGAGITNGMAQALPEGERVAPVAPYFYGPYGFHPFGWFGFGPLGCLVPLLICFLIFGAMRMLFWSRWGGWGRGGMGRFGHRGYEDWPDWMKERAEDWHRRMHGEAPDRPPKNEA